MAGVIIEGVFALASTRMSQGPPGATRRSAQTDSSHQSPETTVRPVRRMQNSDVQLQALYSQEHRPAARLGSEDSDVSLAKLALPSSHLSERKRRRKPTLTAKTPGAICRATHHSETIRCVKRPTAEPDFLDTDKMSLHLTELSNPLNTLGLGFECLRVYRDDREPLRADGRLSQTQRRIVNGRRDHTGRQHL